MCKYDAASGYQPNLSYNKQPKKTKKSNKKDYMVQPPYSENVKTNIGRTFLKLIKNNFKRDHKYHKIFNRNALKISYFCTRNIENLIKRQNSKILNTDNNIPQRPCNCRVKANCPMNGDCLATNIIYKAEVCHENTTQT